MGETLPLFTTSFNRGLAIESRAEHLTGDGGTVVQRELLERSGIVSWMVERLEDPRRPEFVTYPLADLLRTVLMLLGQPTKQNHTHLKHETTSKSQCFPRIAGG